MKHVSVRNRSTIILSSPNLPANNERSSDPPNRHHLRLPQHRNWNSVTITNYENRTNIFSSDRKLLIISPFKYIKIMNINSDQISHVAFSKWQFLETTQIIYNKLNLTIKFILSFTENTLIKKKYPLTNTTSIKKKFH